MRQAFKEGLLKSEYLGDQIPEAKRAGVISAAEATSLGDYHSKVRDLLAVDDFAPDELRNASSEPAAAKDKKVAKKATKKK